MIIRKFTPGSKWLYFKIYTGIKTADIILEEVISPALSYLKKNNLILKWFFIRYSDPKPHLRIRFLLTNSKEYNNILNYIHNVSDIYVESGEINNIQLDTYKREMERYGSKTIEDTESLFKMNSEFTLDYLHLDDEEKIIISVFYIDKMLDKLNLSIEKRLGWIKESNYSYKQEFNADKKLNNQLDKKYRIFKPKYLEFTHSQEFSEERTAIIQHIEENNTVLQHVIQKNNTQLLKISLQYFFRSIIHMAINRMFISEQRLFEMIIYDYLHRYYKTLLYKLN
ncbi:thiopeptide-type bacteriocin biosynthesis protein [Elizabethkingia ursingii]|uniref:thiopeptide-type bacteriocin biosynthesis protein n=1 Tax=Elizabethkingia TaxID=308865 RepID=UPI0020121BFD|nr:MULTISPECIES: thiopeptide-type bacteriocin biosynthesis protein [Elizabethkingia]MCL1667505.1 thiopeptide-type bacteriocin biosynthesis protein [Elizabethkingia ursingii]WQM40470.1 thiopeptide-type bacteriocin biosynthesis protein [Elizabethkingia miricola]